MRLRHEIEFVYFGNIRLEVDVISWERGKNIEIGLDGLDTNVRRREK